jgi:hypothetical protein
MFDFHDERQKSLLIGSLMVGGGVVCLLAIFVGHAAYGRLLGKLAGALLVYGVMRIWRAVKGGSAPRETAAAPGVKAKAAPLAHVLLGRQPLPVGQAHSQWDRACLMLGRAGGAVMALGFLCFVVTVVLFQVQRTVVLIGVADLASGYALLAALVFSLLVGISWARLTGARGLAMAGRALALGLVSLSLLLVPRDCQEFRVWAGG